MNVIRPLHPVAKSFFDRISAAGGNVSDKAAIIEFVTQLSKIVNPSYWVCWPLRSQHNIGTGTTVHSLGNLRTLNGTLVNGPTWGSNGITGSSTGQMNLSAFTIPIPTTIVVHNIYPTTSLFWDNRINGGNLYFRYGYNTTYSGRLGGTYYRLANGNYSLEYNSSVTTDAAAFRFVATSLSGNVSNFYFGNSVTASNVETTSVDMNWTVCNQQYITLASSAVVSLMLAFSVQLNQTQVIQIYDLIKSTLGNGLNSL